MATITKRPIHLNGIRMRDPGTVPMIKWYTEANSQAFVRGDLVYLSSGALTECGADPAAIMGISLGTSTNVTSGNIAIPVLVLTPGVEVAMNVYHATAASATFSDNSGIETAYEINQASSGIWTIDIAATSSTRVHITEYLDAKGDIYMRCWVRFLAANLQSADA